MASGSTLPPGPGSPSLVQGLEYALRPARFFSTCSRRFGETFTVRMPVAPRVVVMFTNPDAIRQIFSGDEDDLRGGESSAALRPILGPSSILALDGVRPSSRAFRPPSTPCLRPGIRSQTCWCRRER